MVATWVASCLVKTWGILLLEGKREKMDAGDNLQACHTFSYHLIYSRQLVTP